MNLTMIDVSSVPHVKAGDIVTVLGKGITADELAKISNTINYEVVTRINPTIKRLNIA
jgi:alanine racemase